MLKRLFWIAFTLGIVCTAIGGFALVWGYYYITRDLPQLSSIEDYRPNAVSRVFAQDGSVIAEFFKDERRYPVKIDEVPQLVRNCFIAAEDASFYTHPGIDLISIVRAMVKNLETGSAKQGASTITQQVVKNLLLTSEKKLERKIKEAILSYRIERRFTKNEILEMYLNQIFFGSTAYGVKAAAWVYFQKPLEKLTLAEAAVLAGLPQAPSRYSPIRNLKEAKRRQRYVLTQMLKAGFISKEEFKAAADEELKVRPLRMQTIYNTPYYATEVRSIIAERWKDLDIDRDGLEVYTAVDVKADAMLQAAMRRGLREVDKRRGWRGPLTFIEKGDQVKFVEQFDQQLAAELEPHQIYPALITHISPTLDQIRVFLGAQSALLDLKNAGWAKRFRRSDNSASTIRPELMLRVGDVIEVSLPEKVIEKDKSGKEKVKVVSPSAELVVALDQTPDVEGAAMIQDPHTGKVVAVSGGYSFQRSVFNRATQSYRQPGSSFKPVVYLAAVDGFGYTPATIVHDEPRTFRVGNQLWSPGNFDEKYLGAITLRTALEKSRNLVSAEIVSQIGLDAIVQYAKKLGIQSQLERNLSISLGSEEVTLLELVRAYGVLAARGVLFPTTFITKIVDRRGVVLYDYENEKLSLVKQAINENSAFIMANMMKGVVEHGTGYRIKELGRPTAGKTGTSNDQMDAWFLGYTPEWVCGVWVGFDQKKEIGDKETGGKAAAPIFLYAMTDFLKYQDETKYEKLVLESKQEAERLGIEYVAPPPLEPLDFSVPDGVDPFWVDKATGLLAEPNAPGAIREYFLKGTEPSKRSHDEADTASYLESPEL